MEKLRVGKIGKAQGIKGEVRVHPTMDDISDFLSLDKVVTEEKNMPSRTFHIEKGRIQKDFLVIKFKEINDRNEAEMLNGLDVFIDREDAGELNDNEYYYSDIIDSEVFTIDGRKLGVIRDIITTGANDIYSVVDNKGHEMLLPAIKDVIKEIDIQNKLIKVELLKGLEDLNP
jgi:16S rRNA processing protein RimM